VNLKPITIRYLSGHDVAEIALSNDEILGAIEDSLRAQGNGDTVIEPRMHLRPSQAVDGHFNVLRGYIAPGNNAGIKIVGGRVTRETIHGELGDICAEKISGREADTETCLFWHRGLSISDIALGSAMLKKAERLGIGHTLPYA